MGKYAPEVKAAATSRKNAGSGVDDESNIPTGRAPLRSKIILCPHSLLKCRPFQRLTCHLGSAPSICARREASCSGEIKSSKICTPGSFSWCRKFRPALSFFWLFSRVWKRFGWADEEAVAGAGVAASLGGFAHDGGAVARTVVTLFDGPALLRGKVLDGDESAPAVRTFFVEDSFGSGGASRHLMTCAFAWEMRTDFWHTGQKVNRDAAAAADDAGEEEVANAEKKVDGVEGGFALDLDFDFDRGADLDLTNCCMNWADFAVAFA